ncbi:MAG: (d)CMP kinase [Candidatus Binataceae bacterium]
MTMRRSRPVIAIDGPVGAGKSTVAGELARRLDFAYVNTGAMYRAVAVAARAAGVRPGDVAEAELEAAMAPLLDEIVITFDGERVKLEGRDITMEISQPEISDLASRLSALGVVRARMRALQRAAGEAGGVVMEGRDIGTAVFPDAEIKFFLDAHIDVRARRRWAELRAHGSALTFAQVREQLRERDQRDQQRPLAPLRRAADAVVIDSSALEAARVVDVMKARVDAASRVLQGLKRG